MSETDALIDELLERKRSRGDFLGRALALGFSLSTATAILETWAGGEAAAATAAASSRFVVGFNENLTNLDPHLQSGVTWGSIATNIWDTLTHRDPQTLALVPGLASEWKQVGARAVRFTLRPGVRFHNGAPLTAQDVKFSLQRIQNPKTGSFWKPEVDDIAAVQVLGPTQFVFKLKRPVALGALLDTLRSIRIVSARDGAKVGTKPNGTGPFKFAEWKKNDSVRLTKNAAYWENGVPGVDVITFKILPDPEAAIAALQAGDIDALATPPLKDLDRVGRISRVRLLKAKLPDLMDVIQFNRTQPPFDDVHLRRMVMYAFDRSTYFKQFLGGKGTPQTTPFPKGHPFRDDRFANAYPFSLDKAKAELAAAGYGSDKPLSFAMSTIATGFPEWEAASVMLQANLKQIGVSVDIRKLELGTWIDELFKSKHTLTFDFLAGISRDPSLTFLEAWALRPGKSFNGVTSARYTQVLTKGSETNVQAKRKAFYDEAVNINIDQVYVGILGPRDATQAVRDYVKGYVAEPVLESFRTVRLAKK
jgi:peptide/nickel transport system substrate-binding protein